MNQGNQVIVSNGSNVEISPNLERFPIVDFCVKDGVRYLSGREKVLVEVWLRTGGNIGECKRQLEAIKWRQGGKISSATIVHYMTKRPHIVAYVAERMRERALAEGYDETKWKAEGIMYKDGMIKEGKTTFFYWKELGKALGYYKEPENPAMQMNQQINFVQWDGNE